jgi:hypothetical protein
MDINSSGYWKHNETGEILDVYELEPVGNILCVWCQDVGQVFDTTDIWSSDEWLGHCPVDVYCRMSAIDDNNWTKISN